MLRSVMSNERITTEYRKVHAEDFKIIEWLVAQSIVASAIEGANYLSGSAGSYVRRSYRQSH